MPFSSNPGEIVPQREGGCNEVTSERVREYCDRVLAGRLEKPGRCELCGRKGRLNWHSTYRRKVIMLSGRYEVPVKRLYCKGCGRTFVHLPAFILKHRRYGADVIGLALEEKRRKSYEEVVSELSRRYGLLVDVLSVWLWKRKIRGASLRRLRKL